MSVHLPTVASGINPGGLWTRLCTDDGELLAEHPLTTGLDLNALAVVDADLAVAARARGDVVRYYVYDGDTGECIVTLLLPALNQ